MANTPAHGGARLQLNVTTGTQIQIGPGHVYRIHVIVEPTANGGVYDTVNATTPAAQANQIAVISYQPGQQESLSVEINAPYVNGLYVDPGVGGVVAVSYN